MFTPLGICVGTYTLWAAFKGRVYARSGPGGRMVEREVEPRWFWTVIVIYGCLSIALLTVF